MLDLLLHKFLRIDILLERLWVHLLLLASILLPLFDIFVRLLTSRSRSLSLRIYFLILYVFHLNVGNLPIVSINVWYLYVIVILVIQVGLNLISVRLVLPLAILLIFVGVVEVHYCLFVCVSTIKTYFVRMYVVQIKEFVINIFPNLIFVSI